MAFSEFYSYFIEACKGGNFIIEYKMKILFFSESSKSKDYVMFTAFLNFNSCTNFNLEPIAYIVMFISILSIDCNKRYMLVLGLGYLLEAYICATSKAGILPALPLKRIDLSCI